MNKLLRYNLSNFLIALVSGLVIFTLLLIAGYHFLGSPLSGTDRNKRIDWAYRQIESHSLEQKKQILNHCNELLQPIVNATFEEQVRFKGGYTGRVYLGNGEYQNMQFVDSLPFLKFDTFRYDGFGCSIFIQKEFDGGIGYYVKRTGSEFEIFVSDFSYPSFENKVIID